MNVINPHPITSVNLKLLQTFTLVAEHSSFREAADQTFRSQSAISTQIKQLEAQIGCTLFHRTTRRVRLTREGEQLLNSARRAIQEVSVGLQRIYEAVDLRHGQVSIGCAPTIAATQLATILAAFEKDYPKIQVVVRELLSKDLFETVRKGDVDFAVGTLVPDSDFSFETLADDEFHALVPASLRTSSDETLTLEELATLPILVMNPNCAIHGILLEAMRVRGLTLQTKYQVMQMQTLISMSELGLGAAVLPRSVVPWGRSPHVKVLKITPTLSRQIALIRVPGQSLSPAAQRLSQLIRQTVRHGQPSAAPYAELEADTESGPVATGSIA